MFQADEPDDRTYAVVVNEEEQYSIWPAEQNPPVGWQRTGVSGTKAACLHNIERVWVDMRPLSLRRWMQEQTATAAE
ncbi:MbtH family NRPS accessory protein [Streptomyces canus]|uniref:MbtH family protein n=1 Tax=Streptomyces canus TaxID=58343 RepID=UPI002E2ACA12|nr:MbtH family NRPS accessory protein [Streptomyces canus]